MGTGVGEAMLIGAAVGAGTGAAGSAIQGGDPLQGALIGGATGAIGGGVANAFNPSSVLPELATPTVTGGAPAATPTVAAPNLIGESYAVPGVLPAGTPSTATPFSQLDAGGVYPGGGTAPQGFSSQVTSTLPQPIPDTYKPNVFNYQPGEAGYLTNTQLGLIGGGSALQGMMQAERDRFGIPAMVPYRSSFDPSKFRRSEPEYAPGSVYRPEYKTYAAEGGIMRLANGGGPVERMSAMNTAMNPQGGLYPQGMIDKTQYATPIQRPVSSEMVSEVPAYDRSNPLLMAEGGIAGILEAAKAQGLSPDAYQQIYGRGNAMMELQKALKEGQSMARGGISSLGGYSDGGRMLKGPGDGMSDSIPGIIANKQPARLADGEFVVPADVVSHLGNGSTDAGAKQLYSMMDKVRKARTGKKAQGKQINPNKYVPA